MPTGYLVPDPPFVSPKATVVAQAASTTLTVADMGKQHTNTGAGAGIVLTLPAAAVCGGCAFRVQVTAAFTVTLDPLTGKIYLGGSGVADKNLIIAAVIGNYAEIFSDGVDWMVLAYSGVVTKEA